MATTLPTYTGGSTSLVQPTGTILTDSLIVGSKWGTGPVGTGASVTFSFPTSAEQFDVRANVAGNYHPQEATEGGYSKYLPAFSAFGNAEKAASREMLASWAAVADIKFNEVAADGVDAGVLRFAYSAAPGALTATTFGASAFPQDFAGAGDTWMNSGFLFPEGWAAGTQNFLTLLHEAGHAIGLKHPHDTGMNGSPGWPATPTVLPKTGDDTLNDYSTQNTVLAYNDIPRLGSPVQADFAPTTPMQVDIAAIQYLYGPNLAHNAGDTVYTFSSTANYNQTIWDGGGRDTIRVDGAVAATVNLAPGTWSQVGLPLTYSERTPALAIDKARPDLTDPRTVFIYDTVTIENAIGGGGNDTLIGNAAANRLEGRGGNDSLDGAGGIDSAVYSGARGGYTVARGANGWGVSGGSEGNDGLLSIERLVFADGGLALDTGVNGHAGQTAQILRALFGSSFLQNPSFVGAGISLLDGGMPYATLVEIAVGLPFIEQLAGSNSNTAFARHLFKNVVGSEPDAGTLASLVGALDAGAFTKASLGLVACQIAFNTASVELVGLVDTGIAFTPQG